MQPTSASRQERRLDAHLATRGQMAGMTTRARWEPCQVIEAEVVRWFVSWLRREGWSVRTEVDHVDVVADRPGVTLLAEAKGRTSAPGLDIDTAYGQLLRRMNPEARHQRYAIVVPASARRAAERVRPEIRTALKIDLYIVADDGTVELA